MLEQLHELEGVVEVEIRLNLAGGSPTVVVSHEHVSPSILVGAVTAAGSPSPSTVSTTCLSKTQRSSPVTPM
ncbi:hypothetical protein [Actinotalea sp.]|uniref:hypothetical protein n=1 Tax=Actinotalea sp. TaxID=1872145 RepID=UPI0035652C2A